MLQRGQDFLAAEMALVLDTGITEANERIESTLDVSMTAMLEREILQQKPDSAVH